MKRRDPAESFERTALASALEAALAAKAARNAALDAEASANSAVWRAMQRVEDAESTMVTARAQAGRALAEITAAGNTLEMPAVIRDARVELAAAEEQLGLARDARDGLNARRAGDDSAVIDAGYKVTAAIAAVVRAEAAPEALAAEVLALQQQLANKAAALMWLVDTVGALPRVEQHGGEFGMIRDRDIRHAIFRMQGWGELLQASPLAATLRAAAAALESDAKAPVPNLGGV